jgi:ethanolamine ammonia-lyase small subunit
MGAKTTKLGKTQLLPEERPTPMPAEELQADIEKDMALAACAAQRKPAAVIKKKAIARLSTASEKEAKSKRQPARALVIWALRPSHSARVSFLATSLRPKASPLMKGQMLRQ